MKSILRTPIGGLKNGEYYKPTNEIYYKFSLATRSSVSISHCGSAVDTYMHLLDNNGNEIAANNDNGPLCSGLQASIKMMLNSGTYYVVSEGYRYGAVNSGDITTTISSVTYPSPTANLSYDKNFIVTYTPKISGMLDADSICGKNINELNQQVQYFDGLGRPMQTDIYKGSPGLNDIVQPVLYDNFGRETKNYLPYVSTINDGSFKQQSISRQEDFYTGGNAKCVTDNRPFSETILENSPLNRPLQQFGPGEDWYPTHSSLMDYQTNITNEVYLWTTNGSGVVLSGFYDANTLNKTQATDENGNKSWIFKDLQGKTILKQTDSEQGVLNTYYVYDDFDRLAYVIPPKATPKNYSESDADFKELLYAYKYDGKGRMTQKQIPGAGWIYMVYNNLDQMILSQDAKQCSEGKWNFTKYDALGRVIMTGSFSGTSRSALQATVDGETILWETRNNDLTSSFCYTSNAFPQSSASNYTVLTVNYYDSYGFDSNNPAYAQITGNPLSSNMVIGLQTGSKVKVLDDTNTWLTNVIYYDDKGRPLQVSSKNILGTWEKATSIYDFTGKVIKSVRAHNDNTLTITNRYVYDNAGRKKEVYQQMNSEAEVQLADYNYNELGQLVKKYLHGNSTNYLQGIDYRYNIRGWLTNINNATLDATGINEETTDAFGEELSYNNSFPAGNTSTGVNQWNGNISGVKWKSKGPTVTPTSIPVNAYAFKYDKLNRMTLADYGSSYNDSFNNDAGYYNEELTYDAMGNISTLKRNCGSNTNPMDDLTYDYSSNSNKLFSVTDNSANTFGFNDGNKSGADYLYDLNGNLITDNNKSLTIDYNYLNLPKKVTKGSEFIDYIYDATGRKLKKTFNGHTQYYIDGIEYDNNDLLFAMTEEGRASKKSNGSFTYDYFLKDHLGNVRVVLGTDNTNQSMVYPAATMETMTAATESTYYSNLDKARSFTPVGFKSLKKNEKVAHLKGTDPNRQIGPSITIKVNSGDTISLTAQSFYPDNTGFQRTGLAEMALSQLVNAIINPVGLSDKGKAFATDNLRAQGFDKSTGYQNMMNKLPNSDYNNENNRPKAYMVWMLFDNEMKLVKTGNSSGARQIPEGAGQVKQMAESDIVMDQGGFLTAYTVNESPASVYIDNFQLSQTSGSLLEENHYYPFGMRNEGLPHSDASSPLNNYKYNDKELQTDLSLQWLDYGARFYDPQIGRWHSVDPLAELTRKCSPYVYGFNNPIRFVDPDGMQSVTSDSYSLIDGNPEQEFYNQNHWLEQVTEAKNSELSGQGGGDGNEKDPKTKTVKPGQYIETISIIVGGVETCFNLLFENNHLKQIIYTGNSLTISNIAFGGLQILYQYTHGGMKNVNKFDLTGFSVGLVGFGTKVAGPSFGLTTSTLSTISEGTGFIGLGLMSIQLWNAVYKPMNDLRSAPSYIDANGQSFYGDPVPTNWGF